MPLTNLLVPTFTQMLRTLSELLKKAQSQTPASEALLSGRLSPDMHPLSSQVRFACLQVQEAMFRLQGQPLPAALNSLAREGHDAGERPGSISDAQTRIEETLSLLENLEADALDAGSDEPITLELPNGAVFDMTGEQYARDWALPQFYFHTVTAYAILRSRGIDVGKADYVPHMFAYLRPGPPPE